MCSRAGEVSRETWSFIAQAPDVMTKSVSPVDVFFRLPPGHESIQTQRLSVRSVSIETRLLIKTTGCYTVGVSRSK